jgi:hypothetical protein
MKNTYSYHEKVVRGSIMAISLFIGIWLLFFSGTQIFFNELKQLEEADLVSSAQAESLGYSQVNEFCLNGTVMHQLMQGFGSEEIANEVEGSRLNCEARIIREEIVNGVAVLDVEIDCECQENDCKDEVTDTPEKMRGRWQFTMN